MANPNDDEVGSNASDDTVTQIGKFEFRVVVEQAEVSPEQHEQRVEALAAWLLDKWHREQQEKLRATESAD